MLAFVREPAPPFGSVVAMQQRGRAKVLCPRQRPTGLLEEEGRTGRRDGDDLQKCRPLARPAAVREHDADVGVACVLDPVVVDELDMAFDGGVVDAEVT